MKRNILLNPGPATTTNSVKYAQVVPDICPREKEFGDLMQFVSHELTCFVGDPERYAAVLFGGSGTAAVEAILSSAIGPLDKLLIVDNGAYGKRMREIAQVYGLVCEAFESSPYLALDLKLLETGLLESKATHLAIVHSETTSGLLNDVAAIGAICERHGATLIVDAMSSFGAVPLDAARMNISFLAASANKNLQGMAGVSFVIAERSKLEEKRAFLPKSYYLDLFSQYAHFEAHRQLRFTPPVQVLYALKQAIIETKEEGIANRYRRYSELWRTLVAGIEKMGLKHLVDKDCHSRIITSIVEPDDARYDFEEMHDFLYQRGVTVYPGKLSNRNTFRVANIGDLKQEDIVFFLSLLEEYLKGISN